MSEVFWVIQFIPIICTYAVFMATLFLTCAIFSISLYQLFHLQIIYPPTNPYNYPNSVFIIIHSLNILLAFSWISSIIFLPGSLKEACSFDEKFNYTYSTMFDVDDIIVTTWIMINVFLLLLSNLIVNVLYLIKIRRWIQSSKFTELIAQQSIPIVHKRIVLTAFYQMTWGYSIIIIVITLFVGIRDVYYHTSNIILLAITISMYLEMGHNKSKYIKLLKCMNKCDGMCNCGCSSIIVKHLKELQSDLTISEEDNPTEYERSEKIINIGMPMIITIAIGNYDTYHALTFVDQFIRNLKELFANQNLQYSVDVKRDEDNRFRHTSIGITQYLNQKATEFDTHSHLYDSIIIAITSIGINDDIVTSDGTTLDHRHILSRFHAIGSTIIFIWEKISLDERRDVSHRIFSPSENLLRDVMENLDFKDFAETKIDYEHFKDKITGDNNLVHSTKIRQIFQIIEGIESQKG